MIRYSLACDDGHRFEAWFRDSQAFEDQNGNGLLACPQCGTWKVRKALMAPSVRRNAARPPAPSVASAEPPAPQPETAIYPTGDEQFRKVRAALRELHAKVKENAENVGPAFPEEARKIHDGEAPARSIYGTATGEEVQSLVEDGIEIMPLPSLPDDRN